MWGIGERERLGAGKGSLIFLGWPTNIKGDTQFARSKVYIVERQAGFLSGAPPVLVGWGLSAAYPHCVGPVTKTRSFLAMPVTLVSCIPSHMLLTGE